MKKNLFFGSVVLSIISVSARADAVNFNTFITQSAIGAAEGGQTNVIGITYAGNKFVGSLFDGAHNNQLYQSDLNGGSVTAFGTAMPTSFQGEVVVAASLGQAGFNKSDIYAGAGSQIFHYANSGGVPTLFTTIAGQTIRGIMFDPGSTFGGNMMVTTDAGNVYSIDGSGNQTLVKNIGMDGEGMDIVGAGWGKYTGDLAVTTDENGFVTLINPNGTIDRQQFVASAAETISFVPLNLGLSGNPIEGFYEANYASNIQKAGVSDISSTLLGHLLVTAEFGGSSPVTDIQYSGNDSNPFQINGQVGTLPNQGEDGIFVTAARINAQAPEPSSLLFLGTMIAGIGLLSRRKRGASVQR